MARKPIDVKYYFTKNMKDTAGIDISNIDINTVDKDLLTAKFNAARITCLPAVFAGLELPIYEYFYTRFSGHFDCFLYLSGNVHKLPLTDFCHSFDSILLWCLSCYMCDNMGNIPSEFKDITELLADFDFETSQDTE